jgi:hypothetical protein
MKIQCWKAEVLILILSSERKKLREKGQLRWELGQWLDRWRVSWIGERNEHVCISIGWDRNDTFAETVTTILWVDQSQVEEEDDIGGRTPWRMAILNTDVKSNLTAYNSQKISIWYCFICLESDWILQMKVIKDFLSFPEVIKTLPYGQQFRSYYLWKLEGFCWNFQFWTEWSVLTNRSINRLSMWNLRVLWIQKS